MQYRLPSRIGAFFVLRFFSISFAVLYLTSGLLYAQDSGAQTEMVFEIEGLTAHSYADVYKAFESHPDYTLDLACVPAQMLLFRHRSNSVLTAEDVAQIKLVVSGSNASLNTVNLLSIDRDGFDSTCLSYRLGTPNE